MKNDINKKLIETNSNFRTMCEQEGADPLEVYVHHMVFDTDTGRKDAYVCYRAMCACCDADIVLEYSDVYEKDVHGLGKDRFDRFRAHVYEISVEHEDVQEQLLAAGGVNVTSIPREAKCPVHLGMDEFGMATLIGMPDRTLRKLAGKAEAAYEDDDVSTLKLGSLDVMSMSDLFKGAHYLYIPMRTAKLLLKSFAEGLEIQDDDSLRPMLMPVESFMAVAKRYAELSAAASKSADELDG